MNFGERVGNELRQARKLRGMTLIDAAVAAGMSEWKVCRIELGQVGLSLSDAAQLASIYNLSLDVLAGVGDGTIEVRPATIAATHVMALLSPRALRLIGLSE